ncbi:hypothetical protein NP777_29080 [Streptomyces sp. RCU064]|uniref:Uncharacterized protein n=1 Tax=Streptomyces rugosispiralis TaxID=2967341 RepID=A0ABT1V4F5_9ACTN|nr:hypothetical protein [Streptomyces rugosispiralis]
MSVIEFALAVVLVLAIGGCACVAWTARGGPRWARGVSTATMALAEVVLIDGRKRRRRRGRRNPSSGMDG